MHWIRTVLLAILCVAGAASAIAQEIPFRLVRNMILLPVKVNGVEITGRLDTGGTYSIIHPATANKLGLSSGGAVAAGGLSGRSFAYKTFDAGPISIGDLQVSAKPLLAVELRSMAPDAAPPIDITLGMDMVRDLVMEIDFDRSVIRFTPAAKFSATPAGELVSIRRVGNDRSIKTAITGWTMVRAGFDTGNPGTIEISDKVAQKALAGAKMSQLLANGIDGSFVVRTSTVPSITLAGQTFENVPVTVSAHQDERIGLGMDILKRFNLVLDFTRDRMWMRPNSLGKSSYSKDRFGLWVNSNAWPRPVLLISPGSPAANAGLKAGDNIAKLLDEAGQLVEHPDLLGAGTKLTVVLTNGRKHELVASDYF
ncbi:MAG: aspartyl protease family protein [Hyphomonadaceae bacterium]